MNQNQYDYNAVFGHSEIPRYAELNSGYTGDTRIKVDTPIGINIGSENIPTDYIIPARLGPATNLENIKLKADTSVATKLDTGKANWSLMPFEAVEEILKVLEFGALKYDGWNFAKGAGMNWTRISNSLLRHTFAWVRGEDKDPESGLSHLGHIGCNVIFLIYYAKYKEVYGAGDDRFKR